MLRVCRQYPIDSFNKNLRTSEAVRTYQELQEAKCLDASVIVADYLHHRGCPTEKPSHEKGW